ncbi:Inositolphosphotransferase 1 [Spathaspora sp. JA1]|nr:Inositolphosphotransferase 1 [Spathaspora sp. JA1]
MSLGSLTGFTLVVLGSYLIFTKFFTNGIESNEFGHKRDDGNFSYKLKTLQRICTDEISTSSRPSSSITSESNASLEDGLFELPQPEELDSSLDLSKPEPRDNWNLAPVVLLACSWIILNMLYSIKTPVNKPRNIAAWIFEVPVHFIVPPCFAVWLYLFHPPGAVRLFIFSLGLQNITILITYLIFPNAPPSFIKIYGDNKEPTFDMIYSDGITSIDMSFSVMLNKLSYYATPNKFASFPSFHSACSCLIFFFVCYYSKWSSFKLLGLINVLGQWWSVLYLDHHWRFDCLAGMLYAITTWIVLKKWKHGVHHVHDRFTNARAILDFKHGSTMGMRLFRNTRFESFFDPQA